MKFLRSASSRNILLVVAGLAFFNLGFLQNELRILQIRDCGALFQVLANTLEEERESGSESSEEDPLKGIFELSLTAHDPWESSFSFATKRHSPFESLFLNPGYKSTFSPPPENFLL